MKKSTQCFAAVLMLVTDAAVAQDKLGQPNIDSSFFVIEVPNDTSGLSPDVAKYLLSDKAWKLDSTGVGFGPYNADKRGVSTYASQRSNTFTDGDYRLAWPKLDITPPVKVQPVESNGMVSVTITLEEVREIIELCRASPSQGTLLVCKKLGIQP